ncbi:MAG: hypothetical protein AAF845_09960 [Bacteroidota bacterium]
MNTPQPHPTEPPSPPENAPPENAPPENATRPWILLGRLSQAVREQNWFAVMLELGIVVLGVVIGFQVTAWGNERAARAEEQVPLRGLHADFVANRAKYDQTAADHALRIRQLRDLHAMTGPDASEPDAALFDSLLYSAIDWENFDPTVGRIDAALGSGQIALIQSDSLQAALASWPSTLADMEENEHFVADLVLERFIPYLHARYPIDVADARAGFIEPARPNPFPVDRQALLTDLVFANLVEEHWVQTLILLRRDGAPVRQLIEDLLRLIEAELDR